MSRSGLLNVFIQILTRNPPPPPALSSNLWILIAPSRLLVTFSCLKQAIHTLRQDPSKQQEIKQSTKLALTPLPPSLSLSNMTLANDLQYPASRNPHVVCMYSTPNNQYDEKTGLFNSNTTFIFLAGSGDTPLLVFSSEKGAKPLLLDSLPQAYFHESRQLDSTTGHDAADGRVHEFEDHHPRPIDFVQVRIDPSHRYLILLDGTAGRIYILHPTL